MSSQKLSARAVVVWAAACTVYVIAITGRTSFGVAGVDAIARFHIDASRLAVFTSVQVGVYALSQIPVGMLIDRFGPRLLLLVGALTMAIGQLVLGLALSYPLAIGARVLIGAGDATAFLSVMRLLPVWFPVRKAPLFSQLTGGLGQIGQFLSAVPFLHVLHVFGWEMAFIGLGAIGALWAILASLVVADAPYPVERRAVARPSVRSMLATVTRDPVVWQGVFIHWTNMMPITVFLLLWGVPMMTLGMGLDRAAIGVVLTAVTVASVAAGPLHGIISARLGRRRDGFAGLCALAICLSTAAFFASGSPHGVGPLLVMLVAVSLLTPAANYGFDTIRETVDLKVLATATGLANMGGFTAIMIAAQLLGAALDVRAPGAAYDWSDFRVAWLAVGLTWALGMVGYLWCRAKVRAARPSVAWR